MPLKTIVGDLFTRYTKSINHLQKHINNFLFVTIIGNRCSWWRNIFLNANTMNDTGEISQVLNNPHGRCVVGAFEKHLHEVSIWTGHISVLYFILHK